MSSLIECLPEEIILQILGELPTQSLVNMSRTCHLFYRIIQDEGLWKNKFPIPLKKLNPYSPPPSPKTFKLFTKNTKHSIPPARLCHISVTWGDYMWIQGGHNTIPNTQLFSEVKVDMWRYSFTNESWEEVRVKDAPSKTEHTAVIYDDKLWLFGGYSGSYFTNSLWSFDFKELKWNEVSTIGEVPSYRSAHIAVVHQDKMYIFGGWNGVNQNNDLYSFEFKTSSWTKIQSKGPIPAARCSHTAVSSDSLNKMIIFGGYGGKSKKYLSDICFFDYATETWETFESLPSPRSRMRMVEWNNRIYLYGGWNKVEHFSNFYEFNLLTREWREIKESLFSCDDGKIGQHSMAVYNNVLYIFAGYNSKIQSSTNQMFAYRLARPCLPPPNSP